MKKSVSIEVSLLAVIAALTVSGCQGPREVRRCTDEKGNVLPDSMCQRGRGIGGGYGGFYGYPRWVYGGTLDGNRVRGFRSTPSSNAHVVTPSGTTISRGGFGGRGFSGIG